MKATVLLTALLCVLFAGCSLRKPAKAAAPPVAPQPVAVPPAPPAPLSTPQTHVALPAPQPLNPASLVIEAPPAEPPPALEPPPRPRRTGPPASQPVTPPVAAPPERDPVQEIVSPAESKRLQEEAQARRREAKRILDQVGHRRLSPAQRDVVLSIGNFLTLSEDAEKHNDLRQAGALAERAVILAKELQSGK